MDDEARVLARELVVRLREPVQETRGPDWHLIEASLNEFSLSFRVYSEWGLLMPCFRDEAASPLPIDPLGFGGTAPRPSMDREGVAAMQELARTVLSRLAETSSMEYEEHLPEVVETFVEDRLADFLSAAGAGGSAGAGFVAPPNSLPFVVHTQTQGLAVHCAPAHLLGRLTYFNAPTTPVNGWISPGLWKFGGIAPGKPMVLDPGVFDAKVGQAMLTAV